MDAKHKRRLLQRTKAPPNRPQPPQLATRETATNERRETAAFQTPERR